MTCRTLLTALSLALPIWGCGERAADPQASADLAPLRAAPAHLTDSALKFTSQPGWVEESPSSQMRKAQYRLPRVEGDSEDAELVVFYFEGQGGSVQANIDRWIGQFQGAEGSPAAEAAKVTRRDSAGIPLTIVDVSGTYTGAGGPMMNSSPPKPNFRMIAAVAETAGGPYFFKLTGPQNTVAKWESSFQTFLNNLR